MKKLFLLSDFFLVVSVNPIQAKKLNSEIWPELQTVTEVADRIDHNIKNDNAKAISHFSKTLLQHTEALVKSTPPEAYRAVSPQAKKLLAAAIKLEDQKSESEATQISTFRAYQKLLTQIQEKK